LQLPVEGHPLHTRSLTVVVTQLSNGRWHARGDVVDLRKCSFVPMNSGLQPAGIIHQMTIEVTLDAQSRGLESIETDQPFVAIEPSESSGGECCRDPAPRLQALVGEKLDADFPRRLSTAFGGPRGCSHLLTLFQLMATALPKALDLEATLAAESGIARKGGERIFHRAGFIDGHEIDAARVGVGIQLADFLTAPAAAVASPLDRLALQSDARAYAVISRESLTLESLKTGTRERSGRNLGAARWQDRDAALSELVGAPIMGGLAGRLFSLLGSAPGDRLLLDALLQLAPGYIQIMATMMEKWLLGEASPLRVVEDGEPSMASVGGTPDSCYMWRTGGPLTATRGLTPPSDDGA
jgi:hypothetical protein